VLAQEEWEVVRLAAIAEDHENHPLDTELGSHAFTRRRGEALQPERQPLATLEHIRRKIGGYNFAGQYQQAPAPQGGGMVEAAWFRATRRTNCPRNSTASCRAGTPPTRPPSSAISACARPGAQGQRPLSIACTAPRMKYPELKRAVREQCAAFVANVVLIEGKALGTQLIQELVQ
jgi:hypothetical protein